MKFIPADSYVGYRDGTARYRLDTGWLCQLQDSSNSCLGQARGVGSALAALTLVLTAVFIYFISLPKVTYGLSFKVLCDLRQ